MVQMLLSGTKKEFAESSSSEPQTPPQPSASNSIKDLLAKSPGLVQLLNGTLAQNKRPVTQSMTAKPKPIYFCLPEKQSSLFLFPSSAVMEIIERKDSLYDLMIQFWPSQLESVHSLTIIIKGAGEDVYEALLTWTRDPVRLFAEYLPKITVTPNICYREIQLPCTSPCEVSTVNLVKIQQPQKTATLPSSFTRQSRPARKKAKKHDGDLRTRADSIGSPIKVPPLESNEVLEEGIPTVSSPGRHCGHCGCRTTPMWRRGPEGPSTLCNACGVKWKHGKLGGSPSVSPPKRRPSVSGTLETKEIPPTPTPIPPILAPIKKRKYMAMAALSKQATNLENEPPIKQE
jgi:hypothetical protein